MKKALTFLLFVSPLVVAGLLYMIFQFTDPLTVGPLGVLGVFTLVYLGCLSVLFILIRFGLYWTQKFIGLYKKQASGGGVRIESRKAYYIASAVAFVPVTLLAMHAYTQLQATDVLLVLALLIIAIFYIVKRG